MLGFFFFSENIFSSFRRIQYQLVALVSLWQPSIGRDPLNFEIYFGLETILSVEIWKSVDLDGSQWISVDLNGSWWISVDLSGSQWISVDLDVSQWISADLSGSQWISVVLSISNWNTNNLNRSGIRNFNFTIFSTFNFPSCWHCPPGLWYELWWPVSS